MDTRTERDQNILSLTDIVQGTANEVLRTRNTRVSREELVSAGWVGAIRAVDSYDPDHERAASLRSYAKRRVLGEMQDELRRSIGGRSRPSTANTTAAEDGKQREFVRYKPETISSEVVPVEAIERSNPYAAIEARETVRQVLSRMKPILRDVLVERFLRERTLLDLARERGVTDARICQLTKFALDDANAIMHGQVPPSQQRRAAKAATPSVGDRCPAGHVLRGSNAVKIQSKLHCHACMVDKQREAA